MANQILYNNQELKEFIKTIPFELTDAQKRSVNEICRDLRAPYQMNRLLQGDVGSGKQSSLRWQLRPRSMLATRLL